MLEIGITGTSSCVVDLSLTAQSLGSGDMPVYATPAMVALMENAATKAVQGMLEQGATTVGTAINITHTKASALGDQIVAQATLTAVEGRKLTFRLTASDTAGVIGEGEHTRFIIERERFLNKIKK